MEEREKERRKNSHLGGGKLPIQDVPSVDCPGLIATFYNTHAPVNVRIGLGPLSSDRWRSAPGEEG